jgi:hypothetical protein
MHEFNIAWMHLYEQLMRHIMFFWSQSNNEGGFWVKTPWYDMVTFYVTVKFACRRANHQSFIMKYVVHSSLKRDVDFFTFWWRKNNFIDSCCQSGEISSTSIFLP